MEKYLANGYDIWQEVPEERIIARAGCLQDLDSIKFPEKASRTNLGGKG